MSSSFLPAHLIALAHFFMGLILPAFVFAAGLQLRGLMPGRIVLSFLFWAGTVIVSHIPYVIMTLRATSGSNADEMMMWSAISSLMNLLTTIASVWLGLSLLAVVRRLRNLAMLDPGGAMDREG